MCVVKKPDVHVILQILKLFMKIAAGSMLFAVKALRRHLTLGAMFCELPSQGIGQLCLFGLPLTTAPRSVSKDMD